MCNIQHLSTPRPPYTNHNKPRQPPQTAPNITEKYQKLRKLVKKTLKAHTANFFFFSFQIQPQTTSFGIAHMSSKALSPHGQCCH
jgi:hypothetical protein